jgi:hypothetical protein
MHCLYDRHVTNLEDVTRSQEAHETAWEATWSERLTRRKRSTVGTELVRARVGLRRNVVRTDTLCFRAEECETH